MKKPVMKEAPAPEVARRLYWLEQLIDEEYEGKASAFEKRTGIKMAQVNQWFSGHRALREKALDRLLAVTEKPAGWFDRPAADDYHSPESTTTERDEIRIPQYEVGGAMGQRLILQGDQPGIIRHMTVTQEWAQKNLKAHTGLHNLCIVTGFGDSMKPMYNPGDPLILDKGVKTCEIDAVYFFRVDGFGFIKRLQIIPGEGIRVISENSKYDTWTIKHDADFEVFGRVMKAWRGEDL